VNIKVIADEAGVSRTTLYNQFSSKQGLLEAVVANACEELLLRTTGRPDRGLRETLMDYAFQYEERSFSPEAIRMFRLIVADLPRFPALATATYEAGTGRVVAALSDYLQGQVRAGRIRKVETKRVAERFIGSITGLVRHRVFAGLGHDSPEYRAAYLEETVDMFVRDLSHDN
jgi:AcrR family transcriptional regulator